MSRKAVKLFLFFFALLIVLCFIWSFLLGDRIGENYTTIFLFEPYVIYFPLIICMLGAFLGLIAFFLSDTLKKNLRISSIIIICVGVLSSLTAIISIGTATNKDENVYKNTVLEEKYKVQNLVSVPMLSEEQTPHSYPHSNYIAVGNQFAYHTENNYVCSEDNLFHLEISTYEFENVPYLFKKKLHRYLTDEYFRWRTRIGYYDGETVTGNSNGKSYTYYLSVQEDKERSFSYFAILVDNGNSISLLMLSTYYTNNYMLNINNIIETLC